MIKVGILRFMVKYYILGFHHVSKALSLLRNNIFIYLFKVLIWLIKMKG